MAAGGPGDHPLTDILLYNMEVYGKICDDLIKEISKFISRDKMFEMFDWFGNHSVKKVQLKKFEKELIDRLQVLKKQALENGWEI